MIIIWRNKKAACAIRRIKIKKQERYDTAYHILYIIIRIGYRCY